MRLSIPEGHDGFHEKAIFRQGQRGGHLTLRVPCPVSIRTLKVPSGTGAHWGTSLARRCNFDNGLEPKPSFAVARYAASSNRDVRSGSSHLRPDRDVDLFSHPEAVEEDGELARDTDYCSLLCRLP